MEFQIDPHDCHCREMRKAGTPEVHRERSTGSLGKQTKDSRIHLTCQVLDMWFFLLAKSRHLSMVVKKISEKTQVKHNPSKRVYSQHECVHTKRTETYKTIHTNSQSTHTHEPQGSIFPFRPPSLYLEQGTHGIGLLEDSRLSLAIQELTYWLVYS